MIRLASELPLQSERAAVSGLGAASAAPGEADARLLRMRQARSRPWPFRSLAAESADPVAPAASFVAADVTGPARSLPPGFSA